MEFFRESQRGEKKNEKIKILESSKKKKQLEEKEAAPAGRLIRSSSS
jgi:hypothetical protein